MPQRIDYAAAFPEGLKAMREMERVVRAGGLEASLLELVKIRASQINSCAFCVDMHTQDARANGETEQRIYALVVWRDTPFFTSRERAALKWTEAITDIQQGHASDAVYREARVEFEEAELVKLTLAINQINSWNRIAIAFRQEPGTYRPAHRPPTAG